MALLPIVISVIGILVNGTEYFLLGFVSIGSAVVVYIIFKRLYGGLYKVDPVKYPINPRSKLACGDLSRIGLFILIFGAFAFFGSFFLLWYEGEWGAEYYLYMYEGMPLISNFAAMLNTARIGGIIGIVAGLLLIRRGSKHDPSAAADTSAGILPEKEGVTAADTKQEIE